LHIAIDAHSVGAKLGGNETYATNLIEALAEIDQTNRYTLYVTKREAIERFSNRWPNFSVKQTLPHTPIVRIPLTLAHELRRHPVDLLHVQYTAPPLAPCPVVATIHDLAFEHLPQTFNRRSWIQLRLTVRSTARRSAHVITVSEYSKADIMRTYGLAADRITVTPEAASPQFAPVRDPADLDQVRRSYGIDSDYVLSLCSLQPRKNLVRLIEAYTHLRREHLSDKFPKLVLAGKRGWLDRETLAAAERSPYIKDIIFTGYVPENSLPALYSGACCFVYPSYFEGFGLPVVEAMQCGAPVIAGNRTSLPEVISDAGLLVDPFDHRELANAVMKLVSDPTAREKFRSRGLERAKKFNWLSTAKLTLQVYEQTHKKRK